MTRRLLPLLAFSLCACGRTMPTAPSSCPQTTRYYVGSDTIWSPWTHLGFDSWSRTPLQILDVYSCDGAIVKVVKP